MSVRLVTITGDVDARCARKHCVSMSLGMAYGVGDVAVLNK